MNIVVYIAGPLTTGCFTNGIFNLWKWEQNVRRAEELALKVMHLGFAAVCVHSQARYWFGEIPEDIALAADNHILERCDALLLAEGWQYSKGTKAEKELAHRRGIMVFEDIEELVHWAAERVTQPIELPLEDT